MNLTDSQKQLLTSAIIALVVTVGALLGYTIKITPAAGDPANVAARAIERTGILCTFSLDPCVDARSGRDINVYSDDGTTNAWNVDGSTGNVTGAGSLSHSNWMNVSAPTAIASATPAAVINSAGVSNLLELRKNATPVFSVNGSGNSTIAGSLTVSGAINGVKCYKGQQSVLGAATAIPATLTAAGISTPTWADQSFAAAPGDTYWQSYHTNSAGVVTFGVYQQLLSGTVTPQAATTTVALDYEVCGN